MSKIDYDGLVEQLNGVANYFQEVGCSSTIPAEAATAIQTLRAELDDRDARLAVVVGLLRDWTDPCDHPPFIDNFLAKQEPSQ